MEEWCYRKVSDHYFVLAKVIFYCRYILEKEIIMVKKDLEGNCLLVE